jgi:SpoIID/LytB domain protein
MNLFPVINSRQQFIREQALLLGCACVMILLLGVPPPRGGGTSLNSTLKDSRQNDSEIDPILLAAATAALGQRTGTIIVVDAHSGRVRALVNPQIATTEALMPGSMMKPFTALAALRAGLIDRDSRTACPGRFTGLDFSLPCVHGDHLPPFSPSQAIAYSCNYYFATLGQRLGREKLIETLRPFGFGQRTGLDPATAGTLRPCETGNSARIQREDNHASRQSDCEAREAIGESDHIQVTPMQLLLAYTALVNGGHLFRPQIAGDRPSDSGQRAMVEISPVHRAIITEGMAGAVRYGTARKAHLDSLPLYILGKTGTSAPARGFRANGWFVGFAADPQPQGDPGPDDIDLAVLVLVENSHGADAATISKPIFAAYANAHSNSVETENSAITTNDVSSARDAKSPIRIHLVTENVTREEPLEDYVLGVMRAEGSMESEPEALKALAVAIRTYALKNRGRHAKDGYDFCSTTHCQRFLPGSGSATVKEDSFRSAVRATAGQTLLDDRGQLADAYFGASCGGETANLGTLWGVTPPAYLRGVRDEYCLSGPHASWTDTITRANLLRALQSDERTNVGARIDQIVVNKRDESGRAEFVTLEGEHRKSVRGWDFKIIVGRVLGWNVLKSSRFEVTRAGSNFVFRGSGFGHGLGLCQEGAHVMAARGASYERILEKYFPGTSVKKDDRLASELSVSGRVLNAKGAEDLAEGAAENLCVPPRKPRRPLRLKESFGYDSSNIWHADLLAESPSTTATTRNTSEDQGYEYSVSTGLTNQRLLTISSEHFRVTFSVDVKRRDADQVLSTLESARADFLHRANVASVSIGSLPTLEVRLNQSTGDFTARTGQPWWAAAATQGKRIELQPIAILKRRGVLIATLRHEFAHVMIDRAGHDRAPRWLEEGFAIYLAGEGSAILRYQRRGKLSTEDLEKRLQRPGSQAEMRALYAAAYLAVSSMVRNSGEASVWQKIAAS